MSDKIGADQKEPEIGTDQQHLMMQVVLAEYNSLKNELLQKFRHQLQIYYYMFASIGVLLIIVKENGPYDIILLIPFICAAFAFRYLWEQYIINRIGDYLRKIESEKLPEIIGFRNLNQDDIEFSYVFSWQKIPGIDDAKLRKFLSRTFDIDWINIARIIKSKDDKTIDISINDKALSLTINNEESEVILKIGNVRKYSFVAKKENDELKIYEFSESEKYWAGWEHYFIENWPKNKFFTLDFYKFTIIVIFIVPILISFIYDVMVILQKIFNINIFDHKINSYFPPWVYVIAGLINIFFICYLSKRLNLPE